MYLTAILLAAGKGQRFKTKTPKPLVKIKSRPVIAYSLKAFQESPYIKDIIVVVNADNKKSIVTLIRRWRLKKIRNIVLGGRRRQDSVKNALRVVDASAELVLIHDAARPFIGQDIILRVIRQAEKTGAAIAGIPVKATIKQLKNKTVAKTLPRKYLWEAQTPQVFKKDLLLKAYRQFGHRQVTDDASLVEKLGAKVKVVMGSCSNIKITTPEDLIIARAIARNII